MKITSAILCSETKSIDRNKAMASYCCPDCGNNTVVQASLEDPYCVHCGHSELRPLTVANRSGRQLLKAEETALANLKCPGCNVHLIMEQSTVASHTNGNTGHLHCPVCASSITFASDNMEEDEGFDEQDNKPEETENEEPNTEVATTKHRFVLANLVKGEPSFITAGNKVFCLVNNIVVATSEEDTEKEASDMQVALEATKQNEDFDLEKVLDENDFELAIVDADIEEELESEANETVKEKVTEEVAKLKDSLKSTMGIALAGCNRGLFESTNYLQQGLEKALMTKGHSAEESVAIADEIMEEVSDDFVEEIMRITFDILAKPQEVRDELAKTVAQVKIPTVASTKQSMLPKPFKPVTTASVKPSAKANDGLVQSILQGRKLV